MKILLVDDDPNYCQLLKMVIKMDMQVDIDYCNSLSALRLIDEKQYQFIISDINMPREDGFDVYRYLRGRDFTHYVFLLTGLVTPEIKEICNRINFPLDRLISKDNLSKLYTHLK